jgi:hypothetical protein
MLILIEAFRIAAKPAQEVVGEEAQLAVRPL